jgi:SAM-dependent methyltransferase
MRLLDIVHRQNNPAPWMEGEKIPWNDPDFSRRMLQEHLSQAHDAASRRAEIIEKHVDWIHHAVLAGRPAKILDLGCGPGLYTSRFARLGHTCAGIDFSPASIAYAREQARLEDLRCAYFQHDIRTADYGIGYDLVMLIFGEFNVFSPADAEQILKKAHGALTDTGQLLIEPHTYAAVRKIGEQPASWFTADSGLFSERPHLCLTESFWDEERGVATKRYFIVDASTAEVTRHAASMQAYTNEDYRALLESCGFGGVTFHPSLEGNPAATEGDLIAVLSTKRRRG